MFRVTRIVHLRSGKAGPRTVPGVGADPRIGGLNFAEILLRYLTRAGRRFTVDRSEKRNGTTTTSPFTGRSTPHPPWAGANLSGAQARGG